jgi:general secretion pathway protein G
VRRGARGGRIRRRGFTLVELMVVAIVLAILAAAVVPRLVTRTEVARRSRAAADIAQFETLLELFYLDMGRYPTSSEGLRVLYFRPEGEDDKWQGPYLKKPTFMDPWGHEYVYRIPGTASDQPYEVLSRGADGEEGGEGDAADVQSWIEIEQG